MAYLVKQYNKLGNYIGTAAKTKTPLFFIKVAFLGCLKPFCVVTREGFEPSTH